MIRIGEMAELLAADLSSTASIPYGPLDPSRDDSREQIQERALGKPFPFLHPRSQPSLRTAQLSGEAEVKVGDRKYFSP